VAYNVTNVKRVFARQLEMGKCCSSGRKQHHHSIESLKCHDEFSSSIEDVKYDLMYIMSTQFGLLDELLSNNVLTSTQVVHIEEKVTKTGQVVQLLLEITRETLSNDKKDAFFNVLDSTQQKHVSNLIRCRGQLTAEFRDEWPLYLCKTELQQLEINKPKLIVLIDSFNGLLDEMMSVGCINHRQKHAVEMGSTDESRNTKLYEIVYWGSLANYNAFIRCLLQTKQHHVVALLDPRLAGDIRPLSDSQQSRLNRNSRTLMEIITTKDGLTAELYAADCITWRQKEYIEHPMITQAESNTRLIEIMRRGSETDYQKFIECLNKTGQRHVSRILIEDGTVARIVATISPAYNREQQERRIVDQLTEFMRDIPDEQRQSTLVEMFQKATRPLDQLRENEVTILTSEIGHSIRLFYFTTSLRGLQYLNEIYSNDQLRIMMQDLFIILLESDDAVLELRVDTLRWDFSDYTDCLQQLCTLTDLPILSHIYEMSNQSQRLVNVCEDVRSLPIDQFPFELFEMILVKATGLLFATISRKTPRAPVYTRATITSVSFMWQQALSSRQYIKHLLKRYFKRISYPFKCSPQQVTHLHIEGGNMVRGVAVLKNSHFVACAMSNTIQVFDSRPPFSGKKICK